VPRHGPADLEIRVALALILLPDAWTGAKQHYRAEERSADDQEYRRGDDEQDE